MLHMTKGSVQEVNEVEKGFKKGGRYVTPSLMWSGAAGNSSFIYTCIWWVDGRKRQRQSGLLVKRSSVLGFFSDLIRMAQELMGPLFKSLYAATHYITEQGTYNSFEKSGTQLKTRVEMGKAPGLVYPFKGPSNSQVKERSIAGADFNVFGSGENGLGDKTRMKPTHTHLLVYEHNLPIPIYDRCIMPSRQKLPIALHI
jgi:hypothetical protein